MLSRNYSGKPLTNEAIQERVFKVLKTYDKIVPEKVVQIIFNVLFFSFFWFVSFPAVCVLNWIENPLLAIKCEIEQLECDHHKTLFSQTTAHIKINSRTRAISPQFIR